MTDLPDLADRLHRLGGHAPAPSDDTVRRDLARGRGASRRRALRVGTAGLTLAAVVGVGTAIAVNAERAPAPGPSLAAPSAGATGATDGTPDASAEGVRLVAYAGEQEPGFVVAKVPAGFVLEGATSYNLNVARADDHSGLDVFEDKLVVMLESQSVTGEPEGAPVEVGEHDGWLRTVEGGTQILTYDDGENRVVVQAWKSLGLSDQQVIEFAEGVTVTAEAQAGVG
jgi:hypothetical protein